MKPKKAPLTPWQKKLYTLFFILGFGLTLFIASYDSQPHYHHRKHVYLADTIAGFIISAIIIVLIDALKNRKIPTLQTLDFMSTPKERTELLRVLRRFILFMGLFIGAIIVATLVIFAILWR